MPPLLSYMTPMVPAFAAVVSFKKALPQGFKNNHPKAGILN
jgi:hypothetical protein